jgi:hypothetical protein
MKEHCYKCTIRVVVRSSTSVHAPLPNQVIHISKTKSPKSGQFHSLSKRRLQTRQPASKTNDCRQGSQPANPNKHACMYVLAKCMLQINLSSSQHLLAGFAKFNGGKGMWLLHQRTQCQQPDNCQEWRWQVQLPQQQHKEISPRQHARGRPASTLPVLHKQSSNCCQVCEQPEVFNKLFSWFALYTQLETKIRKLGTRCSDTRRCDGRSAPYISIIAR